MSRAAATLLVLAAGCRAASTPESESPSFTEHVAPIVYRRCASCHREGGAAPFALVDYEDVRRRAGQIVDVTRSRYMPPWLPEPGYGEFEDERVLSDDEIGVLERWADAGAPRGDERRLPPAPTWAEGWELGEPDLVVEVSEPYDLPAGSGDVFRNFVLPFPLHEPRFVEAFELQPSERRLVHHATLSIDPSRASRRLDAQDPGPGFDGMKAAPEAAMPDGHFLGWTPGKLPYREPAGMSWRLEAESDFVLQLHMPTTGKAERVGARLGFFFTNEPPKVVPVTLRLGSRTLDIPAGEKSYKNVDEYVLPVDVMALSVYPHAHYLAKEMEAKALLPDGTERWLIRVRQWDFKWQDFYRYRAPVFLPRGTRVTMVYTYDNSADNPRNPHRPPERVTFGPQSTDEMGDLYLQVLPAKPHELDVLRSDHAQKELSERVRELTFRIERDPRDTDALNSLGVVYQRLGRTDDALRAFRDTLALQSDLLDAHFNLGTLLATRSPAEAIEHLRLAVAGEPDCVECRVRLGNVLRDVGEMEGATAELERAVSVDPRNAWARYSLAIVLQLQGRLDAAIGHYREVVRLAPDDVDARLSLGSALTAAGECVPAVVALERAIALAPTFAEPRSRLAWALVSCPHYSADAIGRAVALGRQAAELSGYRDPTVLDNLAAALAASGNEPESRQLWQRALELAQRSGDTRLAADLRSKLGGR